jgi:nicotinamide-nucleotide amidase
MPDHSDGSQRGCAAEVVARLIALRQTLAVAESITGGLLSAAIVDNPGASRAFRGGLIVYATDLKQSLALVSAQLLAERGPVDAEVALALAAGARQRCTADWGAATTGVAGPERQRGVAVGTVFVAVSGPDTQQVRRLSLSGDRAEIRNDTVEAALLLLRSLLASHQP